MDRGTGLVERYQLKYLVALVEHRNFTRAAASLHVSQPALSRAIQRLERQLDIELFGRGGRELIVTDTARALSDRARTILRDMDDISALAHESTGPVGYVHVALTSSPAIEPLTTIVGQLRSEHPGITVAAVGANTAADVVSHVVSRRCEVGLLGHEARPSGSDLVVKQLYQGEMILAIPPGSDLVGRNPVDPIDLRGHDFVVAPPETLMRSLFDRFAVEVGDLRVAVETSHREAILSLVVNGLGIGILPGAWQALASQAGAYISSFEPAIRIPVWIVHRRSLSAPAAAFVRSATQLRTEPRIT